ncbi:peptidase S58 DmpA [Mycobacteroides saopaulense]|uniref:Peptidase S58 DmpA n=1 Tax=Mycobacteroides saopaulense TaxID=1578165 RepID=A0A1X0JC48_9MYCO|nr:P1 family peptidase [Mycobacteroides saopaulense]ORB60116.1 peptidase S58 DmpA [Mycobacteroides saopaulense]
MGNTRTIGIPRVGVGHWTNEAAETGCTVVSLPPGTCASCEVRGGAPASRELAALAPDKSVLAIDAVVLTGGSAFGLAAADGAMRFFEEVGRGVPTPGGLVPVIPTLALFDLAVGEASVRPGASEGYSAARASVGGPHFEIGRVGAGTGAYTSHWRGPAGRQHGGMRYAEVVAQGVIVGALVAVNAYGDIDHGGEEVSLGAVAALSEVFGFGDSRQHTTIGVIITNAQLDKVGCHIVSQGAHDGLSRSISPPHTRFDGDAFVAAATGQVPAHVDVVRLMALDAVARAIRGA